MGRTPEIRVSTERRTRTAIVCAVLGALLFGTAYAGMAGSSGLGLADQPVLLWMVAHRLPLVTTVMAALTSLGSPEVVIAAIGIIALIWVVWKRELYRPLMYVGATAFGYLLTSVLKSATANPRPAASFMLPPLETNFSFPSGHVIGITMFVLILGYLLWSRRPERWSLSGWMVCGCLAALIIACTRLYLAAHWLTDVVGGFGLGLIVLAVTILVDGLICRARAN